MKAVVEGSCLIKIKIKPLCKSGIQHGEEIAVGKEVLMCGSFSLWAKGMNPLRRSEIK